jgi:methyltransferase family protein
MTSAGMDWVDWHAGYDEPGSRLAHRLRIVQQQIRAVLDRLPPGPATMISICAGQGRDVIEVLATHPRRGDVRARLVELDPRNVEAADAAARSAGLDGVEAVVGDAGLIDQYTGLVPADVVVSCGVFGNLTDADVLRTVEACSALCRDGGTVVWTLHRGTPDKVPDVCDRFERRGFERLSLTPPELGFSVGAHRHTRPPTRIEPGARMFTFVGAAVLRARLDP